MDAVTLAIAMFVCLFFATGVGAWRQMSQIVALKREWDVPLLWRNMFVRSITWLLSTSLSILGALFAEKLLAPVFGEFGAKFSFGVILLLRWWASMLIAWKILRTKYTEEELI